MRANIRRGFQKCLFRSEGYCTTTCFATSSSPENPETLQPPSQKQSLKKSANFETSINKPVQIPYALQEDKLAEEHSMSRSFICAGGNTEYLAHAKREAA